MSQVYFLKKTKKTTAQRHLQCRTSWQKLIMIFVRKFNDVQSGITNPA